jgi:ribosomal protein S13
MLPYEKQIHKQLVTDFKKEFRNFLLTSRFNNSTWSENEEFRKLHPTFNCIYCSPDPIAQNIPSDSVVFILEMNNDTNKIMGIGMIRNHPILNKYSVYDNGNYNRYVYTGKHRINREMMSEEEEQIMKIFDILCFKGNRHMKRGQGLKSFPVDMLYRCSKKLDLVKFIANMFKIRLSCKNI